MSGAWKVQPESRPLDAMVRAPHGRELVGASPLGEYRLGTIV
jgi:hypothetical protein